MAVIIFIIGAINHPNMDWSEKEHEDTKKIARIIVVIETVCIIGFCYLGMAKSYILYMSFGLMLSAVLLVLGKLMKQEVKKDEKESKESDAFCFGKNS